MSEQENLQLVQEIFVAFGQGNIPFVLDSLAEDVEWYVAGSPEHIPLAGLYHGREQVVGLFHLMAESLELQQYQPQEFIAQGDQVVVIGHALGRVKPTNNAVKYDWVHVYTLRDGKTRRFREYLDTAAVAAAFRGAKTDSIEKLVSECEEPVVG